MNLLLDYQKRFLDCLKKLKKEEIIELPDTLKNLTVDLPPKGHKADI